MSENEFTAPDDYVCAEQALPKGARRPMIGTKLKARYADGKWRPLERMAHKLEVDIDHLKTTLQGIRKNNTYGCSAESKRVAGGQIEWRILKLDKAISRTELVAKLAPIVKDLREQAGKTMVTMSLTVVARCAGQLQNLLDEWTE